MKKLVSLVIVMALVLSLAVGASAATNDSITITNASAGETYKIYKLLNLSVDNDEDPTKYTYTVNSAWEDFFKAADDENGVQAGAGNQYVTINEAGAVTAISNAADLAAAAKTYAENNSITTAKDDITATGDSVKFDKLENGYYMIISSMGSVAMTETTPDKANVSFAEKNSLPTLEKKIVDGTNKVTSITANRGDTITYEITVTIPPTVNQDILVHDTLCDDLTYANMTTVTGISKSESTCSVTDCKGIHFLIDYDAVQKDSDNKVVITYTATLDADAEVEIDHTNSALLTYSKHTSTPSSVTVKTFKITLTKENEADKVLSDAHFDLYDAKTEGNKIPVVLVTGTGYGDGTATSTVDNVYRPATGTETGVKMVTGTTGKIVIEGLKNNNYFFEETKQPDGYNILTERTDAVTIDNANATIEVENKAGTELPSTGGVGTTIFYALGGLMFVGALVLLVTNKRMKAE